MPFGAAGEAELLAGRRLDRDPAGVDAGDLGDPGAHRLAVRPDLRRFADERRVEIDDGAASRPHPLRRVGEKDLRRRALPLRIGRREVLADVALGEGAIERVGERVERDVGVGMAAEPRDVGDANAAEPHGVAGREGVDVEALADPRLARVSPETRLGCDQILHCRHLEVGGVAFEHISRRARPFGDRDIVGEVADAGLGCAPMRRQDQGKAKGLGRLHGPQGRARRRREHPAIGIDLLDGVAHRRPRRRRPVTLRGLDRAGDQGRGGEGPHRVVDQHDVRLGRVEGFEAGQNALLARRAPDRRRPERGRCARRQTGDRLVIERPIVRMDDHLDCRKWEARGQRLQRMDKERAPGAVEILLRPVRAEP